MAFDKINNLIDKVIGKEGPLRVPAYWMRKLLKGVVGHITELKAWTEDAMLKLESRIDISISKCLKSTPTYTYAELKDLKSKNLLVVGQKYCITDYQPTVSVRQSLYETGIAGEWQNGCKLVITACSKNEFCTRGEFYYDEDEYSVDYHFDRNDNYYWSLMDNELIYTVTNESGQHVFKPYLYAREAVSWSIIYQKEGTDQLYRYSYPDKFTNYHDSNDIIIGTVHSEDTFKGVISRMVHVKYNVDLPFDHQIKLKFTIETPDENIECEGHTLKWGINSYRNVTIEPYAISLSSNAYDKTFSLPGIILDRPLTNLIIGKNCTRIYCNTSINSIAPQSYDLYIKSAYIEGNLEPIRHVYMQNCYVHVFGTASYCRIVGKDNVAYRPSIYLFNVSGAKITAGSGIFHIFPLKKYSQTSNTLVSIDLTQVDSYTQFVSSDSSGNIKIWNPADFVDAVEVEEQTVETVEE